MSIFFTCDGGCGTTGRDPKDFTELGIVHKKFYCIECAPCVQEYLDELDELHTAVAETFMTARGALAQKWRVKHPHGELPDQ